MDAFENGEAVAELRVLGGELVQTQLLLRVNETKAKKAGNLLRAKEPGRFAEGRRSGAR